MSHARESQDILHYGKRYMLETEDVKREEYLRKAARLRANADYHKAKTLMWWWTEGVREYAESSKHVAELQGILKEATLQHITQGRY